jgi:hypothetical protein
MHSSTSSSSLPEVSATEATVREAAPVILHRSAGSTHRVVFLIVIIAISLVALELGTRLAFWHVSKIERRIATEHFEAVNIAPASHAKSVLLVGNSLLLLGVDPALLARELPASVRSYRFVIENTQLLDWKFALRRLFNDGSRPDVVAVCVGETNILPTTIRGEYSAYYLFRTSDISEIADTVGYDNTRRSSLYFGRYSLFFAGRSALRNFVLNRVDRPYADLLHSLGGGASHPAPPSVVEAAAAERLSDMRMEAAKYGARLVLVVPPGFATEIESAVARGAARAKVPVIAPVAQGTWASEMYSDGFHLNERGERKFTRLLAPQLTAVVEELKVTNPERPGIDAP